MDSRKHHPAYSTVEQRETNRLLREVIRELRQMAGELQTLKDAVARETDVQNGVVVLLDGLKAQLDALIAQGTIDPADLKALSDQLGVNTDALAAAVVRDTPAAGPSTAARR